MVDESIACIPSQCTERASRNQMTYQSDIGENSVLEVNAIERLSVNDVHRTRY